MAGLSTLRGFRLFRMFKLSREWTQLYNLLKLIRKSLVNLYAFAILLLMFLIIFTILGCENFAYLAKFDKNWNIDYEHGKFVDQNYNTFIEGFTTTFVILTGDNWCDIFYKHYRGVG